MCYTRNDKKMLANNYDDRIEGDAIMNDSKNMLQ